MGLTLRCMPNGKGLLRNPLQRILLWGRSTLSNWPKCKETHWNGNKCEERLGNSPEAIVRQATSNNQPLFMNLEIPWGFLAWAVLRWLSGGSCHARKCQFENITWEEKVWYVIAQRTFAWETVSERGNRERKLVLIFVTGYHEHLASRKCVMCARNMGAHVQRGTQRTKGKKNWMRNWIPEQPRKARRN